MAMTELQLRRYAENWLLDNYGMKLVVPLKLNGRLRTTLGWFTYKKKARTPSRLELNKEFVQLNPDEVVLDILKHELVHYALFMQGKPHSDGETYFENELKRKGIVSQRTINKYDILSFKQVYVCMNCNFNHRLNKKIDLSRKQCTCGGKLDYMGKRAIAT